MNFLSFLCTKWMENCEAMTSSPHSFAYSYWLVKKCFLKICETSKCHNFLIFQPIFIRFSLLCLKSFTLSSEIKLNLLWSSSLRDFLKDSIMEGDCLKVRGSLFYSMEDATVKVLSPVCPFRASRTLAMKDFMRPTCYKCALGIHNLLCPPPPPQLKILDPLLFHIVCLLIFTMLQVFKIDLKIKNWEIN